MRILELGKYYPPIRGGIETLLKSLSEGFVRRGAEVRCIVANRGLRHVREQINGVTIERLRSFGTVLSTSICPAYPGSTRRWPADIIHAHFPNPLADLAVLRAPPHIPVVLTYHSDIIRQARLLAHYGRILERLLARADRIVVGSPRIIDFSPWLGRFQEKCAVIPFGIDPQLFQISRPLPPAFAPPAGKPILLTVGRLVGYKGHGWLIQAMEKIDAILWIVGSGPLEADLRRLAGQAGIAGRVRFLGDVSDEDLPALYQACDLFALPSVTPNEAFGLVMLEAMACAKPVVACNLESGVPWVNVDGSTGLNVKPASADELARAINRLLNEPGTRRAMGEAGRERMLAQFTAEQMVDNYSKLFEGLAA